MKITIDATPTELAELIFAIIDYDFADYDRDDDDDDEDEDDDDDDDDEDEDEDEDDDDEDEDEDDAAIIRRAKLEVANAVLTALTRAVHKTAT